MVIADKMISDILGVTVAGVGNGSDKGIAKDVRERELTRDAAV